MPAFSFLAYEVGLNLANLDENWKKTNVTYGVAYRKLETCMQTLTTTFMMKEAPRAKPGSCIAQRLCANPLIKSYRIQLSASKLNVTATRSLTLQYNRRQNVKTCFERLQNSNKNSFSSWKYLSSIGLKIQHRLHLVSRFGMQLLLFRLCFIRSL